MKKNYFLDLCGKYRDLPILSEGEELPSTSNLAQADEAL